MKLLFCTKCEDIFRLWIGEIRKCKCGMSQGKYTDNLNAWYSGPTIPLGFGNSTFKLALDNQPETGFGPRFDAFVISKQSPTFQKKK